MLLRDLARLSAVSAGADLRMLPGTLLCCSTGMLCDSGHLCRLPEVLLAVRGDAEPCKLPATPVPMAIFFAVQLG
jgi:hypothetical protein